MHPCKEEIVNPADLLDNVIQKIQDPSIRGGTEAALSEAPAEVLIVPSSRTGKYHPVDEIGPQGLLIHIYRFASMVPQATSKIGLENQFAKDVLYAAAVLHDSWKPALSMSEYWQHPFQAAQACLKQDMPVVAYCCLLHEGRWTEQGCIAAWNDAVKGMPALPSMAADLAAVGHEIDYWISRREMWDCMKDDLPKKVRDRYQKALEMQNQITLPGITS
jgi:hypothetical protein